MILNNLLCILENVSSKHKYKTSHSFVFSSHIGSPFDTCKHIFSINQLFPILEAPQNKCSPIGKIFSMINSVCTKGVYNKVSASIVSISFI